MEKKFFLSPLLFLACFLLAGQESDYRKLQDLYQQAMKAYQESNYQTYLERLTAAQQILPDHPAILFHVAGAQALNKHARESLQILSRLASMGLLFTVTDNRDFASLKGTPEFMAVEKQFADNALPQGRANSAQVLPDKELITEGVAYDPQQDTFLVSSVHRGKILMVTKNGETTDFSKPEDGLWAVLGIKVDPARRLLWACSAAIPQFAGYRAEDEGKSGLFLYDLAAKKLLKKFLLPGKPENHLLGDLALTPDGEVYATDSNSPLIFSATPSRDKLEKYLSSDAWLSLQGIDFSADGHTMFAADYGLGIWAIDRQTKKMALLAGPQDCVLIGIDGLYRHGNTLIAIQNGVKPQRLIRLFLDDSQRRVEKSEVLAANLEDFDEPTLGVIVNDEFYFIANSQWPAYDEKGSLKVDTLKNPVILRLLLKQPAPHLHLLFYFIAL